MDSRLYPAITGLRALEASVRLGSFSAAAVELGVTQPAISQSIRQLELQLGVVMFRRHAGRAQATAVARRYVDRVGPALSSIHGAGLDARQERTVVIGCSRALLNNWLLERAVDEQERLGSVELRALDRAPKSLDGIDIAILYGERPALKGASLLQREVLMPVGASDPVRSLKGPLEACEPSARPKLLGDHWAEWFQADVSQQPAVRLSETSALLAAALSGRGLALLPRLICLDRLQTGALVLASDRTLDQGRGYWLLAHSADEAADTCIRWIRGVFSGSSGSSR